MPAIPSAKERVRDFGLGLTSPAVMTAVLFGVSSLGSFNELVWYSDPEVLRDERGEGPAVETAANILARGGSPVGFIRADPTIAASGGMVVATWGTPGSNGAITRVGVVGPAITLAAATPKVPGAYKVEIQTGGIVGTATFRWSIDNGVSWIASGVLTAATVALGDTGVTVNFPAGTYVTAETYAWTATGGGGYFTVTGTSTLDAHFRLEMVVGGANGVATFRYACDGYSGDTASERTYSETLTVPAGGTFVVPGLDITLTFTGTHVAGDFFEVDLECAAWNATDLADGMVALTGSSEPWRFLVPVASRGNGDPAAHALLAAALQSHLTTLANASKPRRGMIAAEQGDSTTALVVTSFQPVVAIRCLIAYGRVRRTTTKTFPGYAFPVTHGIDVIAARAAASLPSTDLKRVLSGPLEEVVKVFADAYGDANVAALDNIKVSTLRTFDEVDGFFVTQGRLKSPSGSDFALWPDGIVMDIACETVHEELVLAIGRGIRYNGAPQQPSDPPLGSIDDRDATTIEAGVAAKLVAKLASPQNAEGFAGHVQDIRYRVDRTHNSQATGITAGKVGIRKLGYVDYVETELGFVTSLPAQAA